MVTTMRDAAVNNICQDRACIVILLGAPLSEQNYVRIGVPHLSQHADLVIFDCIPLLGRSYNNIHNQIKETTVTIEVVDSFDKLKISLMKHKPKYALDYIGLNAITPCFQAILDDMGVCFVIQKSGNIPLPSLFSRLKWKFRKYLKEAYYEKIAQKKTTEVNELVGGRFYSIFKRIMDLWKLRRSLRPPDVALLAGSASFNYFTAKSKNILWVGSEDYHIYNKAILSVPCDFSTKSYAVFIDDNLAYASDWTLLGLSPPVTPEKYFLSMQRFISRLEVEWGMPVIIAGHPSAYGDHRHKIGFQERTLVYGHTCELVLGAKAVILHASTATSFAVLGSKPMLFLCSDQLLYCSYGLQIVTMASQLGAKLFNIDTNDDLPKLSQLIPNSKLYEQYIDKYLYSSDCTEVRPWEMFIDFITKNSKIETHQ